MFSLIKTLILLGVVFGALWLGLAYLPEDTSASLGNKAAEFAIKGCRGANAFYESFKTRWKAKDSSQDEPPKK